MSKGVQIAIAALSVFAAVGWLVSSNAGAFEFFQTVSALRQEDLARVEGLRLRGFVIPGSIDRQLRSGYVDFEIRDGEPGQMVAQPAPGQSYRAAGDTGGGALQTVQVRYQGVDVPDLFRDGAEVVVEGGFVEGKFVAERIFAKCPSKYEVAPAVPEQKA